MDLSIQGYLGRQPTKKTGNNTTPLFTRWYVGRLFLCYSNDRGKSLPSEVLIFHSRSMTALQKLKIYNRICRGEHRSSACVITHCGTDGQWPPLHGKNAAPTRVRRSFLS